MYSDDRCVRPSRVPIGCLHQSLDLHLISHLTIGKSTTYTMRIAEKGMRAQDPWVRTESCLPNISRLWTVKLSASKEDHGSSAEVAIMLPCAHHPNSNPIYNNWLLIMTQDFAQLKFPNSERHPTRKPYAFVTVDRTLWNKHKNQIARIRNTKHWSVVTRLKSRCFFFSILLPYPNPIVTLYYILT